MTSVARGHQKRIKEKQQNVATATTSAFQEIATF
jgi:hypothetical protein